MEVSVFNIKGEDTGRKVALNESVFGIEPNDHVIYLDVKRFLAAQRQGTAKARREAKSAVLLVSWVARKVAAAPVAVISTLRCSSAVPAYSVLRPAIIASNSTRR